MRTTRTAIRLGAGIGALAMSLAAITPVAAQEAAGQAQASEGGVQDIVVTAQRRDQRLQDVGVSVTALGNDKLRELGVVDSRDLVKAAPGVQLESTAGGGVNAFLTIRGISQSDYSANQESPNSIYLDEVYLSSPNAAAFTMYDLQRVEILRGPQGGLRYTHETKDFDSKTYLQEFGVIYDPEILAADFSKATVGALARRSQGLWTGKVQLDYKPTDQTLVYASVSRGAKPGGFNTNLSLAISDDKVPFKSEHLWAYEVGLKTQLLDNHLRVNASGFYYDYTGFQGFALITPQSVVGNYDGYFYGAELEVTAAPVHNLDITVAASYLKTPKLWVSALPDSTSTAMATPRTCSITRGSMAATCTACAVRCAGSHQAIRRSISWPSISTRMTIAFAHKSRCATPMLVVSRAGTGRLPERA